jgi:leucine dehydrogenase
MWRGWRTGPTPRATPRPGLRAACSTPCASRPSGASAAGTWPGRIVAIQGLGHVGWHLAKLLRAAGADLKVSDIDPARAEQAARTFGATAVAPDAILTARADILAPCAIGGVITEELARTIPARVVCGAANNQLASDMAGDILHERGILYAPDYVANGGGIINVAAEILQVPGRMQFVSDRLSALEGMMVHILDSAARSEAAPHRVADRIVAERLAPSNEAA